MRAQEKPPLEKIFFENFFVDDSAFELKNWKSHSHQSYDRIQQSIFKNIDSILNSINNLRVDEFLNKKLTFLEFGVPDFLTLYQSNNIDREKIEKCIQHAVKNFEPRLIEPTVKFEIKEKKSIILIRGKIKKKESSFFEIAYYNLK